MKEIDFSVKCTVNSFHMWKNESLKIRFPKKSDNVIEDKDPVYIPEFFKLKTQPVNYKIGNCSKSFLCLFGCNGKGQHEIGHPEQERGNIQRTPASGKPESAVVLLYPVLMTY